MNCREVIYMCICIYTSERVCLCACSREYGVAGAIVKRPDINALIIGRRAGKLSTGGVVVVVAYFLDRRRDLINFPSPPLPNCNRPARLTRGIVVVVSPFPVSRFTYVHTEARAINHSCEHNFPLGVPRGIISQRPRQFRNGIRQVTPSPPLATLIRRWWRYEEFEVYYYYYLYCFVRWYTQLWSEELLQDCSPRSGVCLLIL